MLIGEQGGQEDSSGRREQTRNQAGQGGEYWHLIYYRVLSRIMTLS